MKKSLSLLLSALLASSLLLPTTASFAANPSDCTIVGTSKADTIMGTQGPDVICAGSGSDVIYALGGDDVIRAGSGNDIISGGTGADTVLGESGNDSITGGSGEDSLTGGQGTDKISGGSGEDLLRGGVGNDNLSGGTQIDIIDGGKGSDKIRTGAGADMCGKDSKDVHLDPCNIDNKGPDFGITTTEVRQVSAGTLAVFSATETDASGVAGISGIIGGPSGWVTEWCGFLIPSVLTEGTDKSGTYEFSCTIPPKAVNQNYTLVLRAVDMIGNGSQSEIAFEISGGSNDNKIPEVTNIDLPQEAVAGESFTVTISATDESVVSGLDAWFVLDGGWVSGGDALYASGSEPRVVSQTETDSVVAQDFVFDSRAPAGLYHVWVGVRDGAGNRDFYDSGRTITLTKQTRTESLKTQMATCRSQTINGNKLSGSPLIPKGKDQVLK